MLSNTYMTASNGMNHKVNKCVYLAEKNKELKGKEHIYLIHLTKINSGKKYNYNRYYPRKNVFMK